MLSRSCPYCARDCNTHACHECIVRPLYPYRDRGLTHGSRAIHPSNANTTTDTTQAVKMKKKVDIEVITMDKARHALQCDSATTAGEVHAALRTQMGMKASAGFALMVSFSDKIFAIRDLRNHIMDAVAQVEQAGKGSGGDEKDVAWKVFFRKEGAFEFQPAADPVHTRLMYYQVISGLKCGRCVLLTPMS